MLGTIERIKNAVLFRCNALNDKIISDRLVSVINSCVYHLAEDIISIVGDFGFDESKLRDDIKELITTSLVKKIKRKLFIDSLALQITNDGFVEDYVYGRIDEKSINNNYIKVLNENKNSNQLNMTEDLDITVFYDSILKYVNDNIISVIKENKTLCDNAYSAVENSKKELSNRLVELMNDIDKNYLKILIEELKIDTEVNKNNIVKEQNDENLKENEKGVNGMSKDVKNVVEEKKTNNSFEKYDDMTLFNKVVLSLNTKEERLQRRENKIAERRNDVEKRLEATNNNIEANINRENELEQRKLELNEREIKLNAKLSETEVIFLNIKPLIKGLSSIKSSSLGGNENE